MKREKYLIYFAMFVFLFSVMGCSGANAECKVKAGESAIPQFIINPPGETGEAKFSCKLKSQKSGSPGKTTATYTGECEKVYDVSGNTYTIDVINIDLVNNKLKSYWLEVTGGVYGTDAHVCEN